MSEPTDKDHGLSAEDQGTWDEYANSVQTDSSEQGAVEDFSSLLNAEGEFIDSVETVKHNDTTLFLDINNSISDKNIDAVSSFQMDRSTEEKLRKGRIQIEERLDLHGMTQEKAYEALSHFIDSSFLNNKRCLLVITGKGKSKSTSNDWLTPGQGILKQRVPEWLSSPEFKNKILKIFPSQPKHGGSGALYVYLRQ